MIAILIAALVIWCFWWICTDAHREKTQRRFDHHADTAIEQATTVRAEHDGVLRDALRDRGR